MEIVSIGDLVADVYYDEEEKLIGVDGGITSHNIICNLSSFGFNTKAYGVCGNDYLGNVAIKSLVDCNVKTDVKKLDNLKTKAYHIRKVIEKNKYVFRSIKYCPYCKKNSWYDESYIDEVNVLSKIKNNDIIIFDNLNNKNQYIIDNSNNMKLLDLGSYLEFENLSTSEIINKLKNKFEIINLNERVEKYLIKRLSLRNSIDLYKIIKPKLITVTRSINGCDFIYQGKVYRFPLKKISTEVDDSGAGDAFFSVIIKNWINNNFKLESKLFNKWFYESSELTSKIVTLIGSRTHIKKLYSVVKSDLCDGD